MTLAVADAVDPAAIEDDLVRLVRTPSITGSEEAVADLVAQLAAATGARVERLSPDPADVAADPDFPGAEMPRTSLPVVAAHLGTPGGRRLLLQGHLDVVPPGDRGAWSLDPWAGEVRDGAVWGRGACDMKGGVAAILGALRALAATGAADDLDGEVVALFVPSEEDGGQGMLAAIREGYVADMAVIAEPSDGAVIVAHAGAITFRLEVPGRAAHASKRLEGVSALDKLYVLLRALEADERGRNTGETEPLMTALGLPYPTIVGTIHGGDWASTVLDRVVVDGRYGVKLGQTWQEAETDLRACIDAAADADPFLREHRPRVDVTGGRFSSARTPVDHPLATGVAAAVEAVTGRAPELRGAPYGADMRLLVNEGDTPTVIYGPGDVALAHAADECVPLDDVVRVARVLATWVVRELG